MAGNTSLLTLADLVEQFGPIPVTRIRTNPSPGNATEQDVIEIERNEDRLYELFDGVLVEKVLGFYESYLAILLAQCLNEFAQQHQTGIVVGEAGMMKLLPGEVRIPDVSFISWQRLPEGQIPREPIPHLTPDLAVEVISKGNTSQEMNRKLREYFEAGVRLVWYVYPERRSVHVFTSPDDKIEVNESQTLDAGDVLPGFSIPLARLFAEPKQPPPSS